VNREQEERVARLLAELDDDRFPVRRRASAELEQLGRGAEAALLEALQGKPSLELRSRLERLLDRLNGTKPSPEQILAQRGTEVLERMGTPEAREILQALARGAASDWTAREARLSLKRLAQQEARKAE
jgi:hypothetical protein